MTWTTTTDLFPHQHPAVQKMLPTRVGALLMEMGLGKTRTAIEVAQRRQSRYDRLIWVCPVSLKPTIAYEWRKHTSLPADAIYQFSDQTHEDSLSRQHQVYIVGVESLSSSTRVVLALRKLITARSFVVVDESTTIKNHLSRRSERITLLAAAARYRMILTGTPFTQGVQDLFAQMRFLSPKILGYRSFYSFAANHLEYSTVYPGLIVRSHNVGHLAAKMAPYVYQVTKAACLDLPPKLYEQRYVSLTAEQWAAYAQAKRELFFDLPDEEVTIANLFRLFTALQQIVCGYWNRDGQHLTFPHHRLDALAGCVATIPPLDKVVIWTKYRPTLDAMVTALRQHHGPEQVACYHGGVPEYHREQELRRFRAQTRFLVATPTTGGRGLDLTAAHYVMYYTTSFNYDDRIQSEDRCHRIRTRFPVTYIDVIAEGTIDQRIQDALARKGSLLDAFRHRMEQVKDQRKAAIRHAIHDLVQDL